MIMVDLESGARTDPGCFISAIFVTWPKNCSNLSKRHRLLSIHLSSSGEPEKSICSKGRRQSSKVATAFKYLVNTSIAAFGRRRAQLPAPSTRFIQHRYPASPSSTLYQIRMATTSQTVPDQVGSTSAQPNGSSPPAVHDLFANLPQLPSVPGAQPSYIAFDAFRTAVADQIAKILDLKIEDVYKGVESGKRDADMTVAVPRFRLKGDPKALSKRLAEEVRSRYQGHIHRGYLTDAPCLSTVLARIRSNRMNTSKGRKLWRPS